MDQLIFVGLAATALELTALALGYLNGRLPRFTFMPPVDSDYEPERFERYMKVHKVLLSGALLLIAIWLIVKGGAWLKSR